MPDAMKKKSAQSDSSALRKRPKTDDLRDILIMSTFWHIMDVFSALSFPIKLIPFALHQASWDTSLEHPQHNFLRNLIFKVFKGLPLKKSRFTHQGVIKWDFELSP